MSERRPRFCLRSIFFGMAIVALPLSQYPFVRFVRTSWTTRLEMVDPDTIRLDHVDVSGYYLPTWQFAVAGAVSSLAALAWYLWRRPRKAISGNPATGLTPPS